MSQTIAEAWIAEDRAEGALLTARAMLKRLLAKKFQVLPEEVVQRIEAVTDLEALQACAERSFDMTSLDDLKL
jgi:hypothetical protein